MKHRLRAAYDRLRFRVAARFGAAFGWFYRRFHTPRPGSLGDLLSTFSRHTAAPLTVLQVGANDGLKWDPLHKFIRRDRWQGILLEPQTPVFRDWLEPLHARNPLITTVNAALGPEDGQMNLYRIGFSRARWATGLASFQREQIERVIDSPHVRRHAAKEGVAIPDDPQARIASDPVEVLSVATLLRRHPMPRLDLLFIDTEGFDFEIVKLFDLQAPESPAVSGAPAASDSPAAPLRPRLIVYENAHLSDEDAQACVSLLRTAGYRVGQLGPNSFAVAGEALDADTDLMRELARFAVS